MKFLMNVKTALAGLIAFVVLLIIIFTFGWVNIEPTDVGVQINKVSGNLSVEPLSMGYHFFNKWKTDIITYRVAARAYPSNTSESEHPSGDYYLVVKTNDGQNVDVDLTILYSLVSKYVPKLHQEIGLNYEDQILFPLIRSEARIAVGEYSAEQIYNGKVRETIQDKITNKLREDLTHYPAIQIQDTLIRHFKFSTQYEDAIERKTLAAQQIEINKNLAKAQEQEALQQEAKARGLKLQAVQAAQGKAESIRINAEGHAKAIKIEADATRYQLEQEASGNLAKYRAEAEGKKLLTEAVGGGSNLVNYTFAQNIPDKLQIWGVPTGQSNVSIQDLSGIFGKMVPDKK